MKQRSASELLHLAAAYCSTAERCMQDVQKKISLAGGSTEIIHSILERLIQEGFIDESRYCRSFVNDKFRFNQWGRVRISYELRKKGIAEDLFAEAIDSIDEAFYLEVLTDLLKSKKRTIKGRNEQDLFNKLYRFAIGRGFENAATLQCLKLLFKEDCHADDLA